MKNATISWAKPDSKLNSSPSAANGVNGLKAEHVYEQINAENQPTLRNISFTLPKVCYTKVTNKPN